MGLLKFPQNLMKCCEYEPDYENLVTENREKLIRKELRSEMKMNFQIFKAMNMSLCQLKMKIYTPLSYCNAG